MRAILQSNFAKSPVDWEKRTITGIKLMENDRAATFTGEDGKPKTIHTNTALLTGLVTLALNGSIASHMTHEWAKGEKDALSFRAGAVKNIRREDNGDLYGDYHAMLGAHGDSVLWLAENDPANAALSLVFDYNPIKAGDKTFVVPLNFQAADVVARGAASSALLSQAQNKYTMLSPEDKEEIATLIKSGVTAQLGEYSPKLPDTIATKDDITAAVTAALANYKPTLTDEDKSELALLASAETVKHVGANGGFSNFDSAKKGTEAEQFIQATLSAGTAKTRAGAVMLLARQKPEAYNEALLSGKL